MEILFFSKLLTEVLIATYNSMQIVYIQIHLYCKFFEVQRVFTCIPSGKKKGRMIEKICQSIWVQFSFISV